MENRICQYIENCPDWSRVVDTELCEGNYGTSSIINCGQYEINERNSPLITEVRSEEIASIAGENKPAILTELPLR